MAFPHLAFKLFFFRENVFVKNVEGQMDSFQSKYTKHNFVATYLLPNDLQQGWSLFPFFSRLFDIQFVSLIKQIFVFVKLQMHIHYFDSGQHTHIIGESKIIIVLCFIEFLVNSSTKIVYCTCEFIFLKIALFEFRRSWQH